MPKEEWGTKRLCPTTGKRFYDLNRDPVVSPYTGEVVTLDTGKGSRTMLADKADKQSQKKDDSLVDEEDVVLEDDNDDDNVDLGDDVLEDDDDDDNVSLDDIADVSSEDEDN
ncbi:TIGR02300 family protein [Mesobaculum littorinae]|uniref:TIGR02300 family protein n=1 Tax=Mesobaculum littorinae TaxID=2486419 RepID=A0A438AD48_9RHOB|nr:TIGR02300 family protein [Mesobaculum littorinae]RVV96620.1 TIGR02300 family protein [Mesobaculum littorinae]